MKKPHEQLVREASLYNYHRESMKRNRGSSDTMLKALRLCSGDRKMMKPPKPLTMTSFNSPKPSLLAANPPEFTSDAAIAESSEASAFDLLKNATRAPVTVIIARVSIFASFVISRSSELNPRATF